MKKGTKTRPSTQRWSGGRSTIAPDNHPLAGMLSVPAKRSEPLPEVEPAAEVPPAVAPAAAPVPAVSARPTKKRFTVYLPEDLIERARNAVYWSPGLTVADIAEAAFRAEIDRLEAEKGERFPQREAVLRGGRPVGR
jgi:post-segregation antitoxin (ccd killing protein)